MAEQQYYLGSGGPYIFDDTETYPDGSAVNDCFAKGNQIYLSRAPLKNEEVLRLGDASNLMAADNIVRLATVSDINVTTVTPSGLYTLYTVPVDKSLIVLAYVLRVTAFTAGSKTQQAIITTGGNAPSYNNFNTVTATFSAVDMRSLRGISITTEIPIYVAGTNFSLNITTPSNATVETWAVDLFGYLV